MSIENIVFDLGGVLIEWNPERIIAGFTDDPELSQTLMVSIFDHPDWAAKDRGTYSETELTQRFAQRTGLSVGDITELMLAIKNSLLLMPDTLPLMDELRTKGYTLYCLSNMPVEHYVHLKNKCDFWDKFEGIVISGQVNMVKPEPEIYQYLLSEYQLDPATCVFIDDSPKNIEVARSIGMNGIVFTDVQSCRQELRAMLKNEQE
ncbi:MAG: HAD family phosphatase [Anaerolineales bacterium]|nr:HAD family phosphatase [Chloroflexota bacterium]MBL6981394.1 HAD family phosphatase [Anaerolineales bacterium]